ncbi:acetyl esterase/lipase [Sphingomonas zeicaulis]|uniref:alpha/beta hydrolase family protein n=1 Tax=Sphingomonas zeicaulis TaxID=1632740 RepID=UPI003D193AD7
MRTARLLMMIAAMTAPLSTACSAPAERAALMAWPDLLDRPQPKPSRTIAYGTDALQVVDLWLPAGKAPHPVVLMIHGGCWLTDVADRSIMNWIADDLAKRGIAVWNVEYRGVDRPGGGYPGTFEDVAAAADLLVRDGPKLGLATDQAVVIGHSAGGHLALWLAARPALPATSPFHATAPFRARTVISQGGIPDLKMIAGLPDHGCGTEGAVAMAGTASAARTDVYADTSPPAMPASGVDEVQVNGERDTIAPPAFAADYAAKRKAKGQAVRSVTVAGSGHVELIAPDTKAWAEQVKVIEGALGR